jgi:hypothetical protein
MNPTGTEGSAVRMPFGRHKGRPVEECSSTYLAWSLVSGVRLSKSLREAVEDALVPDRISCIGPRWWYLERQREAGWLPGLREGPAERGAEMSKTPAWPGWVWRRGQGWVRVAQGDSLQQCGSRLAKAARRLGILDRHTVMTSGAPPTCTVRSDEGRP